MTDFKGGAGDISRIRALERQRELELQELKSKREKIKEESKVRNVSNINEKFASKNDVMNEQFTKETVGLVSVEDFRRKRESMQVEEDVLKRKMEAVAKEKEKLAAKKPRVEVSKLSFDLEEEEEQAEAEAEKEKETTTEEPKESLSASASSSSSSSSRKFGKNPAVDTAFLPDKDREEMEAKERERLASEWHSEQERIKNEDLEITYSYYDGSGHRRSMAAKKGTSIESFLDSVRQEFKELRGVSAENLIFVKEDLIIPHEYTFYDLIVSKARGKSGPLFHFDVHEDIRLVHDATIEKDESHAAKVVERRWYERNKHIFPASRWEVYDPSIQRDKYTIHDRLAKH